jgi:hypothetical protein
LGATQIEKATLDASKYGFTQKREYKDIETKATSSQYSVNRENGAPEFYAGNQFAATYQAGATCNPFGGECESCQ